MPTDQEVLIASRKWAEAYGAHHLNNHETVLAKMALAVLVLTPKDLEWLALNDRQALKQVMTALFANSWEEYLDEHTVVIQDAHREAVADAMGYVVDDSTIHVVDDETIEGWVTFYHGWETRAIEVSLANLEKQFEAAGGRGVELADEIDRMRIVLAYRKVPRT